MRTNATLLLAAALLITTSAARAAEPAKRYDPREAFAQADLDHNGVVDLGEFHQRIMDIFYLADGDRDGWLNPTELQQLAFPQDFGAHDKDSDGRLAMREFFRVRLGDFRSADTNDDSELSEAEVVAAYERRGPR